jgi:CheY-like chemotaxis protein
MAKILVIDRDYASGSATRNMVLSFGLRCDLASNLAEGICASSMLDYSIIITCAELYIQNQSDFRRGWEESARCLRRRGLFKTFDTQIIGVLSSDCAALKKQCCEVGMVDVITKPLRTDSIYECICSLPHCRIDSNSNFVEKSRRLKGCARECINGENEVIEEVPPCQELVDRPKLENESHSLPSLLSYQRYPHRHQRASVKMDKLQHFATLLNLDSVPTEMAWEDILSLGPLNCDQKERGTISINSE